MQAAQLTNLTDTVNGVVAQYNSESDLQALIGSTYIGILDNYGSAGGILVDLAQQTINRVVFRDNPQIAQTLQQLNVLTSISETIRQMQSQGATVLAMTVAGTPVVATNPGPHFTGVGNGILNVSVKRPSDGLVLENSFAENILFKCNADSYSGTATSGNEGFTVTGTGNQNNVFAFNWPLGSGGQSGLQAINGNSNNSSGNLLTKSGFNNWTSNVPDNWTLQVGVAGTNIAQENSIVYDGTSSMAIIGDGTANFRLVQEFNSSTGTSGRLNPQTQYGFNIFARRDGVAPGSGVLTVDLADGSGNVIADQNGVANTFNIALTGLTTSFAQFTGQFRTPQIMPSTAYIRLRLSTLLTAGRTVYLDKASFGPMTQLYRGGPYFSVHAGSIPFAIGDRGNVTITNSRGSGGTLSTWQTLLFQLFNSVVTSNEILFPSSNAPTISDTLIG